MAITYALTAIIDPAQVAKLKGGGFSLCFGKIVQDNSGSPTLNVIWSSDSQFTYTNHFNWQETYSIAGTVENTIGTVASGTTVIQPVGLGQSVTVDEAGNLGPAQGPVGSGPIMFYNNCGKLDFSAVLNCTGPKGTTTQAPIYVSIPLQAGFKVGLTPIETVAVWFATNTTTSTIIPNADNKAYQVKYLSGVTSHTISWLQQASGKWEWQTTA